MAHKPDNDQNVNLIKEFAKRVGEKSSNSLKINVKTIDDIQKKGDPHNVAMFRVHDGSIDMSQIAVKKFVTFSPIVDVLEMPLVFRDHDHVTAVIDGKIGDEIRESILKGSNGLIHGLAFTYSGGFRNIYTTVNEVNTLEDLIDMPMRFRITRGALDTMNHLGVKMSTDLEYNWHERNKAAYPLAEEAETIRITSFDKNFPFLTKNIKSVLVTNHSIFLTMVAIHGPLLESLTPEQQKIIKEEAKWLSDAERKLSIQQAIDGQAEFEERGIKFVTLSEADRAILQDISKKVHKKYQDQPVGKYIKAIVNTK